MKRHVALLRGINVGGNRKVPMPVLAELFRKNGCADVRTYINSGNVLFTPKAGPIAPLVSRLEAAIVDEFGFAVPLVVRDQARWTAAIANNPFEDLGPLKLFHVLFLKDPPKPGAAANLDPKRSPADAFQLVGTELYVRYSDVAKSRLTVAYLDKALGTTVTARNWTTVNTLAEMLAAP